ncbi:MAG: 23S rRNA (pseudouridine(1915)-N(3))-methyltransferase RlmH [Proteobacteria bacterium]|nr:23S rRNA (pseudouridine(1915)-N(3))-methyltransferase RlmH [Pseudomonadota bacterium]
MTPQARRFNCGSKALTAVTRAGPDAASHSSMQYQFITPWKLASGPAKSWAEELLQRVSRFSPAQIISPARSLDSEKLIEQFLVKECEKILQDRGLLFFLDERGQNWSSERFSDELSHCRDRGLRNVAFVFGGAYGLPAALQQFTANAKVLSLSQATMAHELSLVVLLEQVYRSETIRAKHPYHHGGASPLAATFAERSSLSRRL